jgi:hypothetical protein
MNRNKFLKEFYPYLLEHYKFLFERRVMDYPKKFQFIFLLTNLMIIIFFQIFQEFLKESYLFYIPLIFLVLPLVLFFIHAVPKKCFFPWFEKENWKNFQLDKSNTYEELWEDIFGTIPHIWALYILDKKLYIIAMNSLLIFLGPIGIIYLFYIKQFLSMGFLFLISIQIIFLFNYFKEKELIRNPARDTKEFFKEWKKLSK